MTMKCRSCGAANDFTGTDYQHRIAEGQMPLFDPIIAPDYEKDWSKARRFEEFHIQNWHVYATIKRIAREAKKAGFSKWSIAGVFEVLRWETGLQTHGSAWKINNSFKPFYARMVMERCPDLEGFFDLRETKE